MHSSIPGGALLLFYFFVAVGQHVGGCWPIVAWEGGSWLAHSYTSVLRSAAVVTLVLGSKRHAHVHVSSFLCLPAVIHRSYTIFSCVRGIRTCLLHLPGRHAFKRLWYTSFGSADPCWAVVRVHMVACGRQACSPWGSRCICAETLLVKQLGC